MDSLVSVLLLYYKGRQYIGPCLDSVMRQTYPNFEVMFVDNGSQDDAADYVRANYPGVKVIVNEKNLGYSGGHNRGIKATDGEYVLLLNPDMFLTPTFIEEKVRAAEQAPRIGMVEGKLIKADFDGCNWRETELLDSTGLMLKKNRKNYERGHGEPDDGRYGDPGFVFGAFGAAPLYKREMLEDVRIGDEYFDEDFFAYREEVDLAWRAQLRDWQCAYNPNAVAYHVHSYTSQTRKQQPKFSRRLQFRNRYLLMLKNDSMPNVLRHSPHILSFEILALGYVLLREPHLLQGYWEVLKLFPKMMKKRGTIRKNKLVSDDRILRWLT